jgi:hypothetical protein
VDAARVNDLKARGLGLVLAGLGGFLLRLEVFGVLDEVEAHASSVHVSPTMLLLPSALVVLGLLLIVLGASVIGPHGVLGRWVRGGATEPSRLRGAAVVLLLFVPGIAIYVWLQLHLHELGFH